MAGIAMIVSVCGTFCSTAHADPLTISLEWRPTEVETTVGNTFGLGLYAVADAEQPVYFSAIQTIIGWEPHALSLAGIDQSGAIDLYSSGFPQNDAYNLNEASPPADGDGLWVGLAFPQTLPASPDGTLLTTVVFEALEVSTGTSVAILPTGGDPVGQTKVIGEVPNQNILGSIGMPASITVVPEPASALALLLAAASLAEKRRN